MRKLGLVLALAALLGALALWRLCSDAPRPAASPFQPASEGGATLTVEEGIAVLHLRGDARERGLGHGRLLRESIAAALERLKPVEPTMVPFAVDDCGRRLLGFVPPILRAELEGIAEGSGRTLNEIAFLNARFELASFRLVGDGDAHQRLLQPAAVGPGPTVVRHIDPEDLDGLAETLLVVVHEAGGDDPLVTVTLPGMAGVLLGLRGGAAATLRPVQVSGTSDLNGLVWPLFLRGALELPEAFAPGAELIAKPTLAASLPMTGSRTGLLQVAPPGATWYPSTNGFARASEAAATGSGGRIEQGPDAPASDSSILAEPASGNRVVVRLERIPEGVQVEFAHGGERRIRVLR